MPAAIQLVAIFAAAIIGGGENYFEAYFHGASSLSMMRHQWPPPVSSRSEMMCGLLFGVDADDLITRGFADYLLQVASGPNPDEEDAEDRAHVARVLPDTSVLINSGDCLAPAILAGSTMKMDHDAPLQPGDLVAFVAAGTLRPMLKIFLGIEGDEAMFYSLQPSMIAAVPLEHLLHAERVSHVSGEAVESLELDAYLPPLVRKAMGGAMLHPPRMESINYAWMSAAAGIERELRKLPA